MHSWAEATGNDRPGVDRFTVLSRAAGHLEDYDHNSMLLSKAAPEDTHWEEVAEWMLRHAAALGGIEDIHLVSPPQAASCSARTCPAAG